MLGLWGIRGGCSTQLISFFSYRETDTENKPSYSLTKAAFSSVQFSYARINVVLGAWRSCRWMRNVFSFRSRQNEEGDGEVLYKSNGERFPKSRDLLTHKYEVLWKFFCILRTKFSASVLVLCQTWRYCMRGLLKLKLALRMRVITWPIREG